MNETTVANDLRSMTIEPALENTAPEDAVLGPFIEPAAEFAMLSLRLFLEASGYRQLYPILTGGALFAKDLRRARNLARTLGAEHGALLGLFALGVTVGRGQLSEAFAETVAELERAQLVTGTLEAVTTTGWVVVPALGGLLLTGMPPTYSSSGAVGASAYIGPDSLRLAAMLPNTTGKRVLDLGTGCGIQGLLAAPGASEVVCTDIEVRSLELTALNAVLNDVGHPVHIVYGDCYEPVADERFDLIVSLPPHIPEVPEAATRSTVASGRDGLDLMRRLLEGAVEHLTPGGVLVTRCQLLCGEDGPLIAEELGELTAGLHCRIALSDWHPLQPYVVELATTLASHGASATPRTLVERYSESLRSLGATGVSSAIIVLRRSPSAQSTASLASGFGSTVEIVGHVPALTAAAVPAPVALVEVAHDPAMRSVAAPGGAPVVLDGPTAALLAAVDGRRSITEVVAEAWGAPEGAAQVDLEDQAIVRLSNLEVAGLVKLG